MVGRPQEVRSGKSQEARLNKIFKAIVRIVALSLSDIGSQ